MSFDDPQGPMERQIVTAYAQAMANTELELREELTRRVEAAMCACTDIVGRTAAEVAVGQFIEFIREGNRVREMYDGSDLQWH